MWRKKFFKICPSAALHKTRLEVNKDSKVNTQGLIWTLEKKFSKFSQFSTLQKWAQKSEIKNMKNWENVKKQEKIARKYGKESLKK